MEGDELESDAEWVIGGRLHLLAGRELSSGARYQRLLNTGSAASWDKCWAAGHSYVFPMERKGQIRAILGLMAQEMTQEQIVAFMRQGSRTGKLAVVRKDGRPHVVPIWFDFDDSTGDLMFLTRTKSVKGHAIQRDPRVSVCVDRMEMPFDFAVIEGTATLLSYDEDPDEVLKWATRTCRRYVGDELADQYGRRNADPSESLVRVTPTSYIGLTGIAE